MAIHSICTTKARLFAIPVAISIVLFILVGVKGLSLGLAQDGDSYLVFRNVDRIVVGGEYIRSRTFGFPLYEIPVSYIVHYLGLECANIYSLLLALGTLFVVRKIVHGSPNYYIMFPTVILSPLL
ncbi:hypothetical protein KA005_53155, partial [bacterium]|nr:hypothetical protein [bacterium]